MLRRNANGFLWVGGLALAAAMPLACGSDDGKRAAYGEAGAGGEAGSPPANAGGSKTEPSTPAAGEGGGPSSGGMPGTPSAGEAGNPGQQPTGGTGAGGVPNEPLAGAAGEAGAPSIPVLPQCQGPTLTFADSYVEDQVLSALGMELGPITPADVINLTDLEIPFNDANIDITGLECLSALQRIHFSDGAVGEPISLLNLLPNLVSLDYSNGYIDDLTPFAVLTHVKALDFSQNFVQDLTPLQSLTQLETLRLNSIGAFGRPPLDVSALGGLTKLTTLDVGNDNISSFAPISKLIKLSSLNVSYTGLADLSAIAPLTKLDTLDVSSNPFTDATVLGGLPLLSTLDISYDSTITSLEPLVQSQYIGSGDYVTADGLDCNTHGARISALIAKGVVVGNTCGL